MKLETELRKLKKHIGKPGPGFEKQLEDIKKNFTSKEDISKIDAFIRDGLSELAADLKQFNRELSVKMQLEPISKIVPYSYIAEKYFNKKKHWIYQRINGNIVNGKPAAFKPDEIKILNKALKDIGKQFGSISVSLTN